MADKTVYVDGTTSTGHYASLMAAITGELAANADLTATGLNGILHIEISMASADTTAVAVSGFTTDDTHYVHIYTTAAQRAGASWNTGKYRLEITSSSVIPLETGSNKVVVDGLQVSVVTPTGSVKGISLEGPGTVSNCLVKGAGGTTPAFTGILANNAYTRYFFNNIVYNVSNNGSSNGILIAGGTAYIYSCVAIAGGSAGYNIRNSGTAYAKNCYAGGCTGYDFVGLTSMTNCASSDTTAGSANGCVSNVAIDTDTFVNVTAGSEDWRMAVDGLSPLQGAGTNTSGESAPLDFTTDIEGDTRDGTWDIGADAPASASLQYARPSSTIAAGSWTATGAASLHAAIGESVASDAEYDRSAASPVNDTMELGLSSVGTPDAGGSITVRVRARVV